jgi:hypothetical protein
VWILSLYFLGATFMTSRVAFLIGLTVFVSAGTLRAQRDKTPHPDLQGTWVGATLTPLQRPPEFKDKAAFTPEEAAEYVRTSEDRNRSRLPTDADRLTQADFDDTYVETEVMKLDGLRTSLIVDPPTGMLPPLLPAANASRRGPSVSTRIPRRSASLSAACSGTSASAGRPRLRRCCQAPRRRPTTRSCKPATT